MKATSFLFFLSFTFLFIFSATAQDQAFEKYTVRNFSFQGHAAKVVFPNQASENGYWVWRARFWGHEPPLDKALLEKGFHVVYVDVADLYGNEEAVKIWDAFYAYCRKEFKLNEKVVLEGMSRGGLIIYNWAAKNTDKVFTIYADAPVCDIKSWPGGLYTGKGSPADWEKCLKAYGLDATSVLDFKGIPIYNSIAIAKATIPVIHVYGEADEVVPASENTDLLSAEFRKAGGTIKLIGKPEYGHQRKWVDACKAGFGSSEHKGLTSSFDYAGPMTETVLMGNLAIRSYMLRRDHGKGQMEFFGRKKLLWDGENMRITNLEEANQFVGRTYREGFAV